MVRKNCKNTVNKCKNLLNVKSGHSEKVEHRSSSVVSSKCKKINNSLFNIFYLLGSKAIGIVLFLINWCSKQVNSKVKVYVGFGVSKIKKLLKKAENHFKCSFSEIKIPFSKIKNWYLNFKSNNRYSEQKSFFTSVKNISLSFIKGASRNKKLIVKFMSYVYPVGGIAVFLITLNVISNFQYCLKVECLGKDVGLIENEYVFADASKEMNSRINYSKNQQPINATPTYTLVRVGKNFQLNNRQQVVNKLLKASDKIICYGAGLYVNENFMGAVKNESQLEGLLNNFLEPYKIQYPQSEVIFADDVKVEKGYYLKGSLCSLEKINKRISKKVEDQVVYTVQKGDAPITIAQKNSMPYAQLKQLNPGMEQDLKPGKQIVVSQSKPFLSVQVNKLAKVTENIPYEVEKVEDANITRSYCKVLRAGKNGTVEKEYKTVIIDGVEMGSEVVNETVTSQPVTQKILMGTKPTVLRGYEGNDVSVNQRMMFPVMGGHISCGWYGYKGHTGIDICSQRGTPIYASAAGRVISAGWKGAYGHCVVIDNGNGITTLYAHNSKLLVSVGSVVNQGDVIAQMGQTGNAYGNHLHFEVRVNGIPRNPANYVCR